MWRPNIELLETYRKDLEELQNNSQLAPSIVSFGLAYYELAGREFLEWHKDKNIELNFLAPYFPYLQINNNTNEASLSLPQNVTSLREAEEFISTCAKYRTAHYLLCKHITDFYSERANLATSRIDKEDFRQRALNWRQASISPFEIERLSGICRSHIKQLEELLDIGSQLASEENYSKLFDFGLEFYDTALRILGNESNSERPLQALEPDTTTTYVKTILFNHDIHAYFNDKSSLEGYKEFELTYIQLCKAVGEWQFNQSKSNGSEDLRRKALSWFEIDASLKPRAIDLIEGEDLQSERVLREKQGTTELAALREHEDWERQQAEEKTRKEQEEQDKIRLQKNECEHINSQIVEINNEKSDLIKEANEIIVTFENIKLAGTKVLTAIDVKKEQGENRTLTTIRNAIGDILKRIEEVVKRLEEEITAIEKNTIVEKLLFEGTETLFERETSLKAYRTSVKKIYASIEDLSSDIHAISQQKLISLFDKKIKQQRDAYNEFIDNLTEQEEITAKREIRNSTLTNSEIAHEDKEPEKYRKQPFSPPFVLKEAEFIFQLLDAHEGAVGQIKGESESMRLLNGLLHLDTFEEKLPTDEREAFARVVKQINREGKKLIKNLRPILSLQDELNNLSASDSSSGLSSSNVSENSTAETILSSKPSETKPSHVEISFNQSGNVNKSDEEEINSITASDTSNQASDIEKFNDSLSEVDIINQSEKEEKLLVPLGYNDDTEVKAESFQISDSSNASNVTNPSNNTEALENSASQSPTVIFSGPCDENSQTAPEAKAPVIKAAVTEISKSNNNHHPINVIHSLQAKHQRHDFNMMLHTINVLRNGSRKMILQIVTRAGQSTLMFFASTFTSDVLYAVSLRMLASLQGKLNELRARGRSAAFSIYNAGGKSTANTKAGLQISATNLGHVITSNESGNVDEPGKVDVNLIDTKDVRSNVLNITNVLDDTNESTLIQSSAVLYDQKQTSEAKASVIKTAPEVSKNNSHSQSNAIHSIIKSNKLHIHGTKYLQKIISEIVTATGLRSWTFTGITAKMSDGLSLRILNFLLSKPNKLNTTNGPTGFSSSKVSKNSITEIMFGLKPSVTDPSQVKIASSNGDVTKCDEEETNNTKFDKELSLKIKDAMIVLNSPNLAEIQKEIAAINQNSRTKGFDPKILSNIQGSLTFFTELVNRLESCVELYKYYESNQEQFLPKHPIFLFVEKFNASNVTHILSHIKNVLEMTPKHDFTFIPQESPLDTKKPTVPEIKASVIKATVEKTSKIKNNRYHYATHWLYESRQQCRFAKIHSDNLINRNNSRNITKTGDTLRAIASGVLYIGSSLRCLVTGIRYNSASFSDMVKEIVANYLNPQNIVNIPGSPVCNEKEVAQAVLVNFLTASDYSAPAVVYQVLYSFQQKQKKSTDGKGMLDTVANNLFQDILDDSLYDKDAKLPFAYKGYAQLLEISLVYYEDCFLKHNKDDVAAVIEAILSSIIPTEHLIPILKKLSLDPSGLLPFINNPQVLAAIPISPRESKQIKLQQPANKLPWKGFFGSQKNITPTTSDDGISKGNVVSSLPTKRMQST